jgi:phosphatidate cytidylyltransferase
MLRTRLWMGAVLIVLATGMLVVDQRLQPWYPFLFVLLVVLAGVACYELLHLLPPTRRPESWLCYGALGAILGANWIGALGKVVALRDHDPWHWIICVVTAAGLLAFLTEMARFREPGEAVTRIGLTLLVIFYLGVLPSFLAQLRWHGEGAEQAVRGSVSLALTIFVPKCCDIGAYFTGRALGKHPMAPVLSPKKTWEGAAGGIAAAVLATVLIDRCGPVLPAWWAEIGFGVTVGGAGMLGDLAESLIKRDCQRKDASQVVPGFGGVLDVVDAVLFAAPVAYAWLSVM